jgi:hypothetical protein
MNLEDFSKRKIIEIPQEHRRSKSFDTLDVNDPKPMWYFEASQDEPKTYLEYLRIEVSKNWPKDLKVLEK